MSLPKICLNMIVKDEEHCILETLQNVTKYIDYYIITDTGSSDNTKKVIKDYFDSVNIKGEIYDVPWKDFGYNRSKALEYCSGKCQYAWVMDADDLVQGDFKLPENMVADGYNVQYGTGFVYWRCQIFKMDKPNEEGRQAWEYMGVLHEYPHCTKSVAKITYLKGDYYIESRRKGSRNKVKDKYIRDAEIFEKALEDPKEKDNSRYVFYLAQSYYDAKILDKALKNYQKRVEMGGWIEEVYYSQYRIALCKAEMGEHFLVVINEFMKAITLHPERVEPYYEIARIFRMKKMYLQAYEYGRLGLSLEYKETFLFCTKAIHDFLLEDEIAISAYYVGEYKVAVDLSEKLLNYVDLPEKYRKRIEMNKNFSMKKIEAGEKTKPLLCFYTGYSTVYSKKEVYGSELALQSIVSYLKEDYRIIVFSENCEVQGYINGIMSFPAKLFELFQKSNEIDILVISRYICFFIEHEIKAKKTYIWVHDTVLQPYWSGLRLTKEAKYLLKNCSKIDGYVTLTKWHKEVFKKHYDIPEDKIHIIGNGLDLSLFSQDIKRVKRRFIYTSCPKRGLDLLLKLFPFIRREFSDAELYIYRGKESFSEEQLEEIKKLEYVHYEGKGLEHKDVIVEFQKADVWLYPTNFPETFCISALEAQMAGCICVVTKYAGLVETIGDRGILCDEIYGTAEFINQVMVNVRGALAGKFDYLRERGREYGKNHSWEEISKKWRGLFRNGKVELIEVEKISTPYDILITKQNMEIEEKIKKLSEYGKKMPNIPIYIINLDRRKDRWETTENTMKILGITNYKRFSAIDGKTLRWDNKVEAMFPLDLTTEKKRNESHKRKDGVVGCAMSHMKLWEQLLKDSEDVYLIFEDDVIFNAEFCNKFSELWNKLRDMKWDILYLGYTDSKYDYGNTKIMDEVVKLNYSKGRKNGGGTFGYCIRKSAAKFYFDKIKKEGMYRAVDWFMIDQFEYLTCYMCLPNLVQSPIFSKGGDSDVMT